MYNLLIIFFLIIYFWIVNLFSAKVEMAQKSKKVSNILDKIIKFSPILGVIVYLHLFLIHDYLKGFHILCLYFLYGCMQPNFILISFHILKNSKS